MSGDSVDMGNIRLEEQRRVMEQILAAGECPFCMDNLFKYHKETILLDGHYWVLTVNQWPYNEPASDGRPAIIRIRKQLLAIAKIHAERLSDLPAEAGQEILVMAQWAERNLGFTGGALTMRFGQTQFSGATVKHLHWHLIEPNFGGEHYQPVRFKIGSNPE